MRPQNRLVRVVEKVAASLGIAAAAASSSSSSSSTLFTTVGAVEDGQDPFPHSLTAPVERACGDE